MHIAVSFAWEPDEFRRAVLAITPRGRILWWTVTAGYLVAGLAAVAQGQWPMGGALLVLGVCVVVYLTVRTRRTIEKQRIRLGGPIRMVLTDDGFTIDSTHERGTVDWSGVTKVRRTSEVVLLYRGARLATPIPKRAFTAAQWAEFDSFLAGRDGLTGRQSASAR